MKGALEMRGPQILIFCKTELRSEGVPIQGTEVGRMLMCDNSRRRKERNEGGRPLRGTRRSNQGKDPERPNQVHPAGDQRDCPVRRITANPVRSTLRGALPHGPAGRGLLFLDSPPQWTVSECSCTEGLNLVSRPWFRL